MISRIQTSRLLRLLETFMERVIFVCRTIGSVLKVYNSVFKWLCLGRCGQDWVSEESQHYNQSSLSCFNKEQSPYLSTLQI